MFSENQYRFSELGDPVNCCGLDRARLPQYMKQIVTKPTRQNLARLLDPIITKLANYYQTPEILSPLDNDPNKDGKPSDHSIVIAEPISEIKNTCARQLRTIKVRPMQEHKLNILKSYFKCEQWDNPVTDCWCPKFK